MFAFYLQNQGKKRYFNIFLKGIKNIDGNSSVNSASYVKAI